MGERDAFFRAVDNALLEEERELEAEREQAAIRAKYLELKRQLAESQRQTAYWRCRQAEAERRAAKVKAETEVIKAEIEARKSLAAEYTKQAVEVTVSPQTHLKEEGPAAITLPSGTELAEVIREEFEDIEPTQEKDEKQESPVRHTPSTGREGTSPGGHDVCPVRESTTDSPNIQLVVSTVRDVKAGKF